MEQYTNNYIEWIGEIPSNWDISKIGELYAVKNIKVNDTDYPPLSVTKKGILPQLETAAKSDAHDDRKLVNKGDFVINSRSDRRGSCGISSFDGSVSLINTVLSPRVILDSEYYNWLFHTDLFADEFYRWGHGIVDDLWTTNWQNMKNIKIPIPPLEEQKKISDFLNVNCDYIDSLINNELTIHNKLNEYKQSLITEVVTKGLNPNITLKDSGAGWMPLIPAHWNTSKFKFHLKVDEKKGFPDLEVLSLYREYGVIPKNSRDDNHNVTSEDTSKYKHVIKGHFVVNKMKAWQGSVAVSEYEGIISPAYYIYKFISDSFNLKYFHYLIRNKSYTPEFRRLSGGIREGQWDLSRYALENILILIPPIEEQNQIVNFLNRKCKTIDTLILEKENIIDKLNEFKRSFIFEYVTGKKEVPK